MVLMVEPCSKWCGWCGDESETEYEMVLVLVMVGAVEL